VRSALHECDVILYHIRANIGETIADRNQFPNARTMSATILTYPDRLTWERRGEDRTADAFDPAGFYVGSYLVAAPTAGIQWNVTYSGPQQSSDVDQCGFATTPEAAQAVAEDHWRRFT